MFKNTKIVMLPTKKASHILKGRERLHYISTPTTNTQPQHLYFISDEDITSSLVEGYKILCDERNHISEQPKYVVRTFSHYQNGWIMTKEMNGQGENPDWTKLIIASTDESLNLPMPNDEFIQKFVELGGVDEVKVEYYYSGGICGQFKESYLKVTPQNNILPLFIKNNYTKEELIEFCRKAFQAGVDKGLALKTFQEDILEFGKEDETNEKFDKVPSENKWIDQIFGDN